MKLPKFIKNQKNGSIKTNVKSSGLSQTTSSLSSAGTPRQLNNYYQSGGVLTSGHQLLLTDQFYKFQPKKSFQNNESTPKQSNTSTPIKAADICKTPVLSRSSPLTSKLFQIKQTMSASAATLTVCGSNGHNLNATKLDSFIDSLASTPLMLNASTCRYAKSSQPKRLQRNRLAHVKSKPTIYALRSTTNLSNSAMDSTPTIPELFRQQGQQPTKDSNEQSVLGTPIRPVCLQQTSNLKEQQVESSSSDKQQINNKKHLLAKSEEQQEDASNYGSKQEEIEPELISNCGGGGVDDAIKLKDDLSTPQSNRFSLAKLSKFVSKSALKMIGAGGIGSSNGKQQQQLNSQQKSSRKSYGSNCSSSSSSSSYNSSMQTDDENENKENLNINLVKLIDSDNQQIQSNRVNSLNGFRMPSTATSTTGPNAKRPCMGLSALMLKRIKNTTSSNCSYGVASSLSFMPNIYLIGVPIVFNSADLETKPTVVNTEPKRDNQQTNVRNLSQKPPIARTKTTGCLTQSNSNDSNYDRLNRINNPSNLPPQKPKSTPNKVQYIKNPNNQTSALASAAANQKAASPSITNCRISVYSGRPKQYSYSSSNLNESSMQQYDSIVF